uniref:Uncharacterized protein n=1 Tax=Scophthalmus maximus TaxID=52904 RepID=A0A8D3BDS3_SCOMX
NANATYSGPFVQQPYSTRRSKRGYLHGGRVHLILTGVKRCFEGLDVSGHARDPVDSHFVDPPLLHLLNALTDYVRHLGALTPADTNSGHLLPSVGILCQACACW